MAFCIVLNNKEPDFLMGLLLFFISKDNMCHNRNVTSVGI
jgi:hypothetical protein